MDNNYINEQIKQIYMDNTSTSYEKIKQINYLFKDIKNRNNDKNYIEIITSNIYLKNIIDSFSEEDIDKITNDKKIDYILEDYSSFQYEDFNYEICNKDSELDEIIKYYFLNYPKKPSKEENYELLLKAKANNKYARDELINMNWRLVLSIAFKYKGRGLDLSDLFQEGNTGFIKAIKKYEFGKNATITTYASYWIKQAIRRALDNEANLIRYTVKINEQKNKIDSAIKNLENKLGHDPSIDEISLYTGINPTTINKILSLPRANVSLNTPIGEKEDSTLEDIITDTEQESIEEKIEKKIFNKEVMNYLDSLNKRDAEVLKLRYGFYNDTIYTLESIGYKLNITRERVRQIEKRGIKKFIELIENDKQTKKTDPNKKENNNITIKINNEATNIYDYFPNSSKEDIDIAISLLNDNNRQIVLNRFSSNSTIEDIENFSKKVKNIIVKRLKELIIHQFEKEEYIERIKQKLIEKRNNTKKSTKNSIYDYYCEYTKEDIDLATSLLSEPMRSILQKRFNKTTCSKEIKKIFSYKVSVSIKNKLQNIRKKRALDLQKQIEDSNNNSVKDKKLYITLRNILISSLKYGFIKEIKFNEQEISDIFKIKIEDIENIFENTTKLYGIENIQNLGLNIYNNKKIEGISYVKRKRTKGIK